MQNEMLGNCCHEKQSERTASEKLHLRKDTERSREESSLMWLRKTGSGVLVLEDKCEITWAHLAIDEKADF